MNFVGSVMCLRYSSRGQSNPIAFGGKSSSYTLADVGACPENEDDRGCVRHDTSCTRKKWDKAFAMYEICAQPYVLAVVLLRISWESSRAKGCKIERRKNRCISGFEIKITQQRN